jgi:hypothetical protein
MITPSYGLTATERVLPRLALDWTTGVAQSGVNVTRAGVATYIDSNGVLQLASADTQRVDYSAGVSGLLVEESRTNVLTYSEDFSNAAWNINTTMGVASGASDPWGGSTAFTLTANGATSVFGRVHTGTAGIAYSGSIWIRRKTGSGTINLRIGDNSNINITSQISSNWARVSGTATPSTTTVRYFVVVETSGDEIEIWGAQLEAGAFPTSYIPTEATAVTRNADVATMTGTNFSDWFNATEGTFAAETLTNDTLSTSNPHVLVAYADASNRITMQYVSSQRFQTWVRLAGVGSASLNINVVRGVVHNSIYGYKANNSAGTIDGNAVVLSSPQPTGIPSLNSLTIGHYAVGPASFLNGHLRKIYYWPQRLINAELQAFSK